MKILQVIPSVSFSFGGPTNAVLGLSSFLARQGEDVTIYTTNADVKGRLEVALGVPVNTNGVKIFYFPIQNPKHYKFSWPLFMALKENIANFDIIHIHSCFQFSTQAACFYCHKLNLPYIIRPLGQLDPLLLRRHYFYKKPYFELFERKNLTRASAVHLTSELERDWVRGLGLKINEVVIPLGIDLDEFENLPAYGKFRQKYPELKDKKIILFLGRINFKKGLDILVEAYAGLAHKRDDLHLVIAGGDDEGYGGKIKKLLKEKGLLARTTFTGMLLGQDKLSAYRDSDIFVLPSYSENFGISVVEAMASGVPVVISNRVGIHSEISRAQAGMVSEINPGMFAVAIENLLDNPQIRQNMVKNALGLVKEKFSLNRACSEITQLYKDVLGRKTCG